MAVSIDVTIAELRRQPDRRPLYVFFEIDQTTFNKETQMTFPLRRVSPQNEPKGSNPPAAGSGRSDRLN